MTARRILSHLALAARHIYAANTYTDPEVRVGIARLAVVHLTDAVALISPAAGVRVAEAARRAFDDAHRRAVSRRADLDAHGLDEGGAAACAPEGTGFDVVDVVTGGADEEGLHKGEGSTRGPVTEEEWAELDRAVKKLGNEAWRFNLREERRQAYPVNAESESVCVWCLLVRGTSFVMVDGVARCTECGRTLVEVVH